MAINPENFISWAKSRFGEESVLVKGKEVRVNSFFSPDDTGHHLWCSPSGGKKKHKFGVYHCWKTNQKGSLVKLVQEVDSVDRSDAINILDGRKTIGEIEKEIEAMLFVAGDDIDLPEKKTGLSLPNGCSLISDLGTNNWWRKKSEDYLKNRKIPIDGLYICNEDTTMGDRVMRYKGRIVIPYYDRDGNLIYFNGRHLGQSKCKYLGPPKEIGIGKEDVVFMAGDWLPNGSTLYVCEGEFNAISLKRCELNAAACGGKNMSEKQAMLIGVYKIVLCLDRDKAGKQGTTKMASILSALESVQGQDRLNFIFPPSKYNDWNEMLIDNSPAIVYHYIMKNQQSLDPATPYSTRASLMSHSIN
jgi:hypothetical protein